MIDKTPAKWQCTAVGIATDCQPNGGSKHEFEDLATAQGELILAYLREPSWRQRLQFWRQHAGDPELRKLLGRIHMAIVNAQRLESTSAGVGDNARERAVHLLGTDPKTLSVDTALEVIDGWDQLLIEHGDERHLRDLLAVEIARDRVDTTATTWSDVFGEPPSRDEVTALQARTVWDEGQLTAVKNRLAGLYRTRSVLYDLHRARQAMKARHLWLLVPVLATLLLAFAVAVYVAGGTLDSITLAGVAGALGASLSGTLKLRDHIDNINDLRAFAPSIVVQPLIGATAGLLLLLVVNSKLIDVNWGGSGWASRGLIAFVAGFSEPFFLGIIGRVAAIGEPPTGGQ